MFTNSISFSSIDNQNHTYAHVKGAVHFFPRNIAPFLQFFEYYRNFPAFSVNFCITVFRKNTRNVFIETATSDVNHTVNIEFFNQRQAGFGIQTSRGQKFFAQGAAKFRNFSVHIVAHCFEADFTNQGETVGMYTARRQAEKNITRFNFFAGNHFAFIYNANAETSNVIFTFGIEACHFSSFAANQSATGFFTSICNTFNDVSNFLRINFIYSNVVKEEQRFCALYQNIVNAHSNCVLTNGVVFVSHESQFQFGTNAVSTRNQNGFFIFSNVQSEQTAKATQVTDNFGTIGSANAIFHQFYCFVTSVNVNTGISISKLFLFFAHVFLLISRESFMFSS